MKLYIIAKQGNNQVLILTGFDTKGFPTFSTNLVKHHHSDAMIFTDKDHAKEYLRTVKKYADVKICSFDVAVDAVSNEKKALFKQAQVYASQLKEKGIKRARIIQYEQDDSSEALFVTNIVEVDFTAKWHYTPLTKAGRFSKWVLDCMQYTSQYMNPTKIEIEVI